MQMEMATQVELDVPLVRTMLTRGAVLWLQDTVPNIALPASIEVRSPGQGSGPRLKSYPKVRGGRHVPQNIS